MFSRCIFIHLSSQPSKDMYRPFPPGLNHNVKTRYDFLGASLQKNMSTPYIVVVPDVFGNSKELATNSMPVSSEPMYYYLSHQCCSGQVVQLLLMKVTTPFAVSATGAQPSRIESLLSSLIRQIVSLALVRFIQTLESKYVATFALTFLQPCVPGAENNPKLAHSYNSVIHHNSTTVASTVANYGTVLHNRQKNRDTRAKNFRLM